MEADTIRESDEEFEADEARADKLINLGYAKQVEGKRESEQKKRSCTGATE